MTMITERSTPEEWLAGMTLEQKVGQVMAVGFDSTEVDAGLEEMITSFHLGGVIFFARNVESPGQVARLTDTLQKISQGSAPGRRHPGLIISVDQEGGRVARLTEDRGFTEFPSAMAVAATGDPQNAREMGLQMGREMKAVGFNADFAPSLDVNNNPANSVIGIRSFGAQPDQVAEFGLAFIDGLQSGQVMAFGKHFPGHGDNDVDSHVALPVVSHNRSRLEQVELVPFRRAIRAGVAGIMSAHVTFPAIDPTPGLAGTLSPRMLTDFLRRELNFQGLIVTDSLEMGALASTGYPAPLAAATALQAGADMLLFNRDHAMHKEAFQLILRRVQAGGIPLQRLDDAVRHVLRAKARFGLLYVPPCDPAVVLSDVGSPETRASSRRLAARSVTLLRDRDHLLPLACESTLAVEPAAAAGLGAQVGAAASISISDDVTPEEIQHVRHAAAGKVVLLATVDASRHPGQVELVQELLSRGISLVVAAVRSPYDLVQFPGVSTYLATYGSPPPSLEALSHTLTGKARPQGRLPVELPGLYPIGSGMQST